MPLARNVMESTQPHFETASKKRASVPAKDLGHSQIQQRLLGLAGLANPIGCDAYRECEVRSLDNAQRRPLVGSGRELGSCPIQPRADFRPSPFHSAKAV